MKTIKVKELEVPTGAMPEVVDILIDNDLDNSLTGTDEDHDFIHMEVSYDKDDDDQKAARLSMKLKTSSPIMKTMMRKMTMTKRGINPPFLIYLIDNQYYVT